MNQAHLNDLIARGMGIAARKAGVVCDAYRPSGPVDPLSPKNRFLRVQVAFNAEDPKFDRSPRYGEPVFYAVLDAAYTRPGDYLVECESGRTWFIASQMPLLPVVVVQTNRCVWLHRPARPMLPGVNFYSGVNRKMLTRLVSNWPASVLTEKGSGERLGKLSKLPADTRSGSFTILLPEIHEFSSEKKASDSLGEVFRIDDLVYDDLDRQYIVASAELSQFGWRLFVREVAS